MYFIRVSEIEEKKREGEDFGDVSSENFSRTY